MTECSINRVYEFVKTQETGQSAVWACLDAYDKITSSQIATAGVTSDNIDWATMRASTTEKVVGTWEDGSLIYERVFTGTVANIPNNTLAITTLQSGGISAVIQATGYFRWTDTHIVPIGQMTFFSPSTNSTIFTCVLVNNNDIQLRCFAAADYTNRPYSVVVRYLKSS
jgi:hypothetical protein